ncbi:MAG TPA: S41 family peptidase [Candidatus Limnocylindria bacterium]|nr:S41 family peptidase [Candidatus Limnocylindria bacterium]
MSQPDQPVTRPVEFELHDYGQWQSVAPPAPRPSRWPVYLAAVLILVLGGGGLFVSGFTLGRLDSATPGTSESRQELFRPFWEAYNDITLNYVGELDQRQLVEGAIQGVFEALDDPFSSYMTEEQYRQSLTGLSGEFEGIGANLTVIGPEEETCGDGITLTCRLTVVRVIRNSPAMRAGLLADDVITAVDGEPTLESDITAVVSRIRGPKGSSVTLSLERQGEPLELSIVRDVIQSEDVLSEVLADGRVGYIKVLGFRSGTAVDLREQLRALVEDEDVEALILDLRDDPGGYVDAARRIASEFVATSPLYWEQSATGEPVPQGPEPGGVATDTSIEMVVLVNGGTASASEIVAGALQGNDRALLVGETTYGKGTIQEWKELAGAGGYRLSVRKWLTPDQTWIHGVGLTPDVVVAPPAEQPPGEDVVRDRAVELLLGEAGAFVLPLAA